MDRHGGFFTTQPSLQGVAQSLNTSIKRLNDAMARADRNTSLKAIKSIQRSLDALKADLGHADEITQLDFSEAFLPRCANPQKRDTMSNLKENLIHLGAANPTLQSHLRPILDKISGSVVQASALRKWESVVRALGPEEALDNLIPYVGGNEARANFKHIARMHNLPIEVSRSKRDLAYEFSQHIGWESLAQEFAQATSKRLLEEAAGDIKQMYGI